MGRQLFTADTHCFHKSIIWHCNRPWANVDKMTKDLIDEQNSFLKSGDILYHIGDWAWGPVSGQRRFELLMDRMRDDVTHHLILGNHDELKPFTYVNMGFTSVHTSLRVKIGDYDTYLVHDPSAWARLPKGAILLCGHIHTLFKAIPEKRTVNVGVDMWDFKPVTEEQILQILNLTGSPG